jgi:ABC-type cobalamin/Fe3+-siderophores transport system ATPase subunit
MITERPEPLLTASDAAFGPPGTDFVVRAKRLSVAPGQLVAVLGPNGSGKTTVLNALAGLAPARAGRVLHRLAPGEAIDLAADPDRAGRFRNARVGYVPQAPALFGCLPVTDNVALREMLRPGAAADPEGVAAALKAAGLEGFGPRLPRELSGGEQQRAAVARGIAAGPPLLVLDEPTAALDAAGSLHLFALLRAYADQGAGVIVACHDLPLALRFADRVWVVREKQVHFPFADDDAPAGGDPLPPMPARGRPADQALALAGRVQGEMFVRQGVPPEVGPPAPPQQHPLPPSVRPGLRTALRLAWLEAFAPGQRLLRLLVIGLVTAAVAAFVLLQDLGSGVVLHLERQTPPDDEFINSVGVTPAAGRGSAALAPGEVDGLRARPGVRGLSPYQERSGVTINGHSAFVVAVPPGDAHLAPAGPDAQIGLVYLHGGPPRPEDAGLPAAIVTRDWLRKELWHLEQGEPDREFPTELVFRLKGRPGADALPGWNGECRVPVVAVADHPHKVVKERGDDVEGVYLTEGFMARLRDWKPDWAFTYRGADGRPLADDYELVREVRLRVAGAPAGWQRRPAIQGLAKEPFYPLVPLEEGDTLVLKLDPKTRDDQLVTSATVRELLGDLLKEVEGLGRPELTLVPIKCTELADSPGDAPPPAYSRAVLRFRDIAAVLDGTEAARAEHPELTFFVRYRRAIENLRAIRFVVDNANRLLEVAFVTAMLFVVGMLSYLHATAKTAEAGILRLHGVPRRLLGRLFLAQLGLLVLPACALAVGLARLAAWQVNPWVAGRLVPGEGAVVFASLQGAPLTGTGWVFGCATAALLLGTAMAVFVANRKPIPESLVARY